MRGIVEFGVQFFPPVTDLSIPTVMDAGILEALQDKEGDDDEAEKMDMETLRQSDGKSRRFGQDKMPESAAAEDRRRG